MKAPDDCKPESRFGSSVYAEVPCEVAKRVDGDVYEITDHTDWYFAH